MARKLNGSGIELMPSSALSLVVELFERQGRWMNVDLAKAVKQLHADRGGVPGRQKAVRVVKTTLTRLKRDGLVKNIGHGLWEAVSNAKRPKDGQCARDEDKGIESEAEKIIGSGSESVYVYFNDNDRKLAKYEEREYWECKIGRTHGSVISRIGDQGIKTAFAKEPVIGLVIKIDDSASLERVLHGLLSLTGRQIDGGCGSEWFLASPLMIEEIYQQCIRMVPVIGTEKILKGFQIESDVSSAYNTDASALAKS